MAVLAKTRFGFRFFVSQRVGTTAKDWENHFFERKYVKDVYLSAATMKGCCFESNAHILIVLQ